MVIENKAIRVAILDPHQMFVEALSARLDREAGINVVATAFSGRAGLRAIVKANPDVVLLDLEVPDIDAFEILDELNMLHTKAILLSGVVSDILVKMAIDRDVCGYLLKSESLSRLIEGIQQVAADGNCFSQDVQARLEYDQLTGRFVSKGCRFDKLTSRQLQVLRHLARGESVKQVARQLHLSAKSVDSHKYRMMHKLRIHDRVELARLSIREGLAAP